MVKNKNEKQEKKDRAHVLLIRLSAMGDVAMLVPVILAFRQRYPTVKITVLTRAFFAPMFTSIPHVTVFNADIKGKHKGVLGLWKLFLELKPLGITKVLDMHSVLRSHILRFLFKINGYSPEKIDKGRKDKKALTTYKNKVFKPLKSTHERYADVFRNSGYPLELKPTDVLYKKAIPETLAKTLKFGGKRKVIGIAPFAAFQGKMYPLFMMEEVIRLLKNTKKYRILLFGGGDAEKEFLQKWAIQFNRCINMAGACSFQEELTVISNLDLMLAMDSGNAHLAAMYGVPVVTLWGVTHPYAGFYPYGQDPTYALMADRDTYPFIPTSVYGNAMPKGYERAMETIPPKKVVEKIESILNPNS